MTKIVREIKFGKQLKGEKVIMQIKPCYLGKSGDINRKEAMALIEGVIINDPTKPGFKMGYRKAANLLNKNGYRNFRKKRWTPKGVANFYYNRSVRIPNSQKIVDRVSRNSTNKTVEKRGSSTTNLKMIGNIVNSNLDQNVKMTLVSMFIKNES